MTVNVILIALRKAESKANSQQISSEIQGHILSLEIWL